MLEDVLKANPGMQETYRAYARLEMCARAVEKLEEKLKTFQTNGASNTAISEVAEQLAQLRTGLRDHLTEASQSLENENLLRTKIGQPPLDRKVLKSAHESLKKYEDMIQELDAVAAK